MVFSHVGNETIFLYASEGLSSYLAVLAVHYAYHLAAIQRHRLTVTLSALHAIQNSFHGAYAEVQLWFRLHESNPKMDIDPADVRPFPTAKN
jgi:hypothetical protein